MGINRSLIVFPFPALPDIRKLRRAKGWRQIDLAEHSGVHEVHISDLERGTREPGLRTLSKIVSALGTTLSEVLRGL